MASIFSSEWSDAKFENGQLCLLNHAMQFRAPMPIEVPNCAPDFKQLKEAFEVVKKPEKITLAGNVLTLTNGAVKARVRALDTTLATIPTYAPAWQIAKPVAWFAALSKTAKIMDERAGKNAGCVYWHGKSLFATDRMAIVEVRAPEAIARPIQIPAAFVRAVLAMTEKSTVDTRAIAIRGNDRTISFRYDDGTELRSQLICEGDKTSDWWDVRGMLDTGMRKQKPSEPIANYRTGLQALKNATGISVTTTPSAMVVGDCDVDLPFAHMARFSRASLERVVDIADFMNASAHPCGFISGNDARGMIALSIQGAS